MTELIREEVLKIALETGFLRQAEVGYICFPESVERLAAAIYSKGFAAGAEDIRERAKQGIVTLQAAYAARGWRSDRDETVACDVSSDCHAAIATLPITPTNQGEQA